MSIETLILNRLRDVYTEAGFEYLTLRLDTLHDFASVGRLADVTALPAEQVRGWLEEIIYVARETIREIDAHAKPRPPDGNGRGHRKVNIAVRFE